MKYVIFLIFILFLPQCSQQQGVNNKTKFEAYLGNIKVSKNTGTRTFHIFVSAMMINNTDSTFFIKVGKTNSLLKVKTNFIGVIGEDTVSFDAIRFPARFEAHDTIYCVLKHLFYKPKMPDSLFLDNIKCMELIYSLPKDSIKGKYNFCEYLDYLYFERQDSSKFVILDDDKVESGFLPHIFEFRSLYPYGRLDWNISDAEKSLVTGKYLNDLCPK